MIDKRAKQLISTTRSLTDALVDIDCFLQCAYTSLPQQACEWTRILSQVQTGRFRKTRVDVWLLFF